MAANLDIILECSILKVFFLLTELHLADDVFVLLITVVFLLDFNKIHTFILPS